MDNIEKIDWRKASNTELHHVRVTVIGLRRKGLKYREIGEIVGLSRATLSTIVKEYEERGAKSLTPKVRGRKLGEKRILTPAKEKRIRSMIIDHHPEQLKLQCCMWNRDNITELIKREFGIEICVRTVGEYLKSWGFTVQKPSKQAYKQDQKRVESWLNAEYPDIKAQAAAEKAEIFWADETAVQNECNFLRGYAPKGQTPVVQIETTKMHVSMISAINNQGKLNFLIYKDALNQDRLIDFLFRLASSDDRMKYVVLDNLKVHHGKMVAAWVETNQTRIRLFFLPPYCPEYNPDEYLNHDLKRSIGTQYQAKKVEEIRDKTTEFMDKLSQDSEHVKSYFKHEKVKGYED